MFLEKLAGARWRLSAGRNWPARRIGHRLHRTCAKADLSGWVGGRRRCLKHEAPTSRPNPKTTQSHDARSSGVSSRPGSRLSSENGARRKRPGRVAAGWPLKGALGGGPFEDSTRHLGAGSPSDSPSTSPVRRTLVATHPLNFLNSLPLFSTTHQETDRLRSTHHHTKQAVQSWSRICTVNFLHSALSRPRVEAWNKT